MKSLPNEQIFDNIRKSGYITEREINLLKRRSNAMQKDLFDYIIFDTLDEIKIYPEQGSKRLKWLKKFINRKVDSNIYGYREVDIIQSSTPKDFRFKGFYDAGNCCYSNYVPHYELKGMEYILLSEPYIIG